MTTPEPLAASLDAFRQRHGIPDEPELAAVLDPPWWTLADADRTATERIAAERWVRAVPPRFTGAHLDDIAEPLRSTLTGWAAIDGQPDNLVLTGPIGTGKTYAAAAAVRPLVELGATLAFWPVVRLLDQLRPGDHPDPYADAASADVLVLDDLGAERPTDWTRERLYALVNDRWLAERSVVVTTNLAPPQLSDAVGERLSSRLLGGATIARLAGHDRRLTP